MAQAAQEMGLLKKKKKLSTICSSFVSHKITTDLSKILLFKLHFSLVL